jgi:cytochrome c oxidase assembly protein subunit 15
MQAVIVASGAAVRLTDAGLGCEDWPTCNEGDLFPEAELHGMVEFGNRLISLLVAVSAVAVVVAARRRQPRRQDLDRLAWAVLGGTVAQVVLGGITVLTDLHPIVVSVHFLLSMVLLFAAQSLWLRAGPPPRPIADTAAATTGAFDRVGALTGPLLWLAAVVLLLGTIVTGTGPNSGDSMADRLNFELESVARIHSTSVWIFIFVSLVTALRAAPLRGSRSEAATRPFTALQVLLFVSVAQGVLGYVQYGLGVPPLLVELHVIGSIAVWTATIHVFWSTRWWTGDPDDRRDATMDDVSRLEGSST